MSINAREKQKRNSTFYTKNAVSHSRAVICHPNGQHFCFSCRPERSAILNNSAGTVVKYAYDAFGNCKVLLDTAD